jgi:hypothetical protein
VELRLGGLELEELEQSPHWKNLQDLDTTNAGKDIREDTGYLNIMVDFCVLTFEKILCLPHCYGTHQKTKPCFIGHKAESLCF